MRIMLELVSPDSAKGAEPGTPVALELRHRVGKGIRNPDVRPIEGYRVVNATDREGAEAGSVAGPQLDDTGAGRVHHPEVRPVEGYRVGLATDREGAEANSVAGRSLMTLEPVEFATQRFAPSKAIA